MNEAISLDEKSIELLDQLRNKLEPVGQSISCHLEGLVHATYVNYWDYTQLNVLLSIQHPRTTFPDENIFIVYHQITELYFKLALSEMEQLSEGDLPDAHIFLKRMKRINRYMENLVSSFDIMLDGMDHGQFLLFRTALAPASGFQSVQFRLMEIHSTGLNNLLNLRERETPKIGMSLHEMYNCIYWKEGAVDMATGRKDLSLLDFERRYDKMLLRKAKEQQEINLSARFLQYSGEQNLYPEIIAELRSFDLLFNIKWRLAHFRSAMKHLRTRNQFVKATGGTNWREYLPPRFQKISFFPYLWSDEEKAEWGRSFVEEHI
jgi:tryptophan 2,3-dioxygenase